MSSARSLFDPTPDDMVSLPLPALRLLLGGRAEQSVDEELAGITEQIAALRRDLQDDEHWRSLAMRARETSVEQQHHVRRLVQGTTKALEGLRPLEESPTTTARGQRFVELVRAAMDLVEALRTVYQLHQGILGIYDDLPADLVERAHRLRWEATKAKVTAEDPGFSTPEGASLLAELDALMQGQTAKDIADTAKSAAEEQRRYEAYVAAGGDPKDYDPSQA